MMTFCVFQSQQKQAISSSPHVENHPSQDQRVVNLRTGKIERVFVDLEAVYPELSNPSVEYSFEELRAAKRGWLQHDWRAQKEVKKELEQPPLVISNSFSVPIEPLPPAELIQVTRAALQNIPLESLNEENNPALMKPKKQKMMILRDEDGENAPPTNMLKILSLNDENDENAPPSRAAQEREIARRIRKEERANKTRKIKVGKTKGETTTGEFYVMLFGGVFPDCVSTNKSLFA